MHSIIRISKCKNPEASVATALKSSGFCHGGGEFQPVSKSKRRREKNKKNLLELVWMPVVGTKPLQKWAICSYKLHMFGSR